MAGLSACVLEANVLDGCGYFLRLYRGAVHRGHGSIFGLARFADVDSALEERTVFNADALCNYIARQGTLTADIHTVACIDVAAHFAEDDDFSRGDVRRYLAIPAHCHAIARQIDRAFHLAIDVQRFGTCHLALNDEALADSSLISNRLRCRRSAGRTHGFTVRG
jgi:hypothetical protein